MSRLVRISGVALALAIAACSSAERAGDDGLKQDLELAFASTPIELQQNSAEAQVVSPIERIAPAPKVVAPSQRAVKHTPAPRSTPKPVEVEEAAISEEVEPAPVEIAEAPARDDVLPSPRPRPIEPVSSGGRGSGDVGIGTGAGVGIGTVIGVVLRGGHAGIDDCDPRVDGRRGRRGGTMAVNDRIPVVGTFPGRIQGTFPGGGRLVARVPSGRSRF